MTTEDERKFVVSFKLVMPGQSRATTYEIPLISEDKIAALVEAENKWSETVMAYDVEIREIRPAGKVQET